LAAFRIVQESLTNVMRHSGATSATVGLTYGERELTVQVDDNGDARDSKSDATSGSGLVGMRERAAALGGVFEAGPAPTGGFRVCARLPLASPGVAPTLGAAER
jgi:signal transduction histidine kinase